MSRFVISLIAAALACCATGCGEDQPASPSDSTTSELGSGVSTMAGEGDGRGPSPTNYQPPGPVGPDAPAPSGP